MLGMWAWEQIYSTPDIHSYTYDVVIPTVRDPKILGLTLDPAFNFSEHIKRSEKKRTLPLDSSSYILGKTKRNPIRGHPSKTSGVP